MTTENRPDRARWNAKSLDGEAQSLEPDRLVVEQTAVHPPGLPLYLAGGAGRHALWLAQRRWKVVLADVSDQGLSIATQRATATSVPLTTRRESAVETLAWARDHPFNLILVVWCLIRDCFAALPSALATGGTLLYKTSTSAHPRYSGGHALKTALDRGELQRAFPQLDTVLYRETNASPNSSPDPDRHWDRALAAARASC
jgi:hypothetical protein